MDKDGADELLAQTRGNYDGFAQEFARTRNYLWTEIVALVVDNFKAGDRVLDIGCGNGRFSSVFKEGNAEYVGVDDSRNLIEIAKNNFPHVEFAVADALALPFKDGAFDLALSVAVLHHIPSNYYRNVFFKEAGRVLKPGGGLIATVWDLRPFSMVKNKQWKRLKSFARSQMRIAAGGEKLDFGDFYIPWKNKYQRYVHSFAISEIKKLAAANGFIILKSGVASVGAKEANLYIVAKKLQN